MHVHMLEPKSKLADADDDDAIHEGQDADENKETSPDDAAHPQHLAGITAHFLHGGGGGAQAAAAAAGGAAGIGELMQHADAMLQSDRAQLAAAHSAHARDKDAVLAERCAPRAPRAMHRPRLRLSRSPLPSRASPAPPHLPHRGAARAADR
jgi:hypothetical protein